MDDTVDLTQKIDLVKKHAWFAKMTNDELETLAGLIHQKMYKPEDVIVMEGDRVDSVYFIVSGTAEVRHIRLNNGVRETTVVATLSAGKSIGLNETGFYSLNGLRTATVVAITEMVILRLSMAAFHGFALSNSHVSELLHTNNRSRNLNESNP